MPRYRFTIVCLVLAAALGAAASTASAQNLTSREYPTLYKSTRAMGMGGAYTAIGGRVDTLFYNPAGLSNIPKDKGWEVNILNLSAESNENGAKFVRDMQHAFDTTDLNGNGSADDDQTIAVNNVFNKYMGEQLHVRVVDFTSFGRSFDSLAFGIGALGYARVDAMPHQGLGPQGILETDADAVYGAIGGVSMPIGSRFFGGLTVKSLRRESVIHNFTPRELVDNYNNLDKLITDDLRQKGGAIGFDAGMLWKIDQDSWWRPVLGLSVMNIGDLDFRAAGSIPMTVNAGFAINPDISRFRSLLIGIDYIDVMNGYEQDSDPAKRVRFGAELQLFDIMPLEISLRAGVYASRPTFGADLRLLTFLFSYAMYSEEIGAYAGQEKDTRHLVTFNFGW